MPLNLPTHNPEHSDKKGNLYVVATPIGNIEDITLRALSTFRQVDIIAAEDTRHTRKLLSFYKIKSRLTSCHEHNEREKIPLLLDKLNSGLSVALVSDAGTPLLSDPGYHLTKEAVANGIQIIPIPGVSAAIAALSVAGMPTDSFIFAGFPARKKAKRLEQLKQLAVEPRTIIFYESPKRILKFLEEIIMVVGDRKGVLSREMTKFHEEFIRGSLSDILFKLKERPEVKGECTLLVGGRKKKEDVSMSAIRNEIKKRLQIKGTRLSELAKEVSKKYNLPKNKVYNESLKIKELLE
ncbi:MAG: 16S rRNA (cytidine(1402)-2'-O)-methyltransferase [Deltaproteobacteria bacterium]|nr:16S rRNA (cytidine(1402)-2'-O)-methyltransferase [Deltaproteobacteria bacterium]MBW2660781.1 16S rRNA (cytidine(1402)-2'-O)-methyltransferase [Deltaproteobacteria bacterium]